jgi:hypothetical protein
MNTDHHILKLCLIHYYNLVVNNVPIICLQNQNCEINFYIYLIKAFTLLRKQVGFDKRLSLLIFFKLR